MKIRRKRSTLQLVRIVAILFILGGLYAAVEMVISFVEKDFHFRIGIIELFAGFGLLRRSREWHSWSIVIIWLSLAGTAIAFVFILFFAEPFTVDIVGVELGQASKPFSIGFCVLYFALLIWMKFVLNRPDVRSLFGADHDK